MIDAPEAVVCPVAEPNDSDAAKLKKSPVCEKNIQFVDYDRL